MLSEKLLNLINIMMQENIQTYFLQADKDIDTQTFLISNLKFYAGKPKDTQHPLHFQSQIIAEYLCFLSIIYRIRTDNIDAPEILESLRKMPSRPEYNPTLFAPIAITEDTLKSVLLKADREIIEQTTSTLDFLNRVPNIHFLLALCEEREDSLLVAIAHPHLKQLLTENLEHLEKQLEQFKQIDQPQPSIIHRIMLVGKLLCSNGFYQGLNFLEAAQNAGSQQAKAAKAKTDIDLYCQRELILLKKCC